MCTLTLFVSTNILMHQKLYHIDCLNLAIVIACQVELAPKTISSQNGSAHEDQQKSIPQLTPTWLPLAGARRTKTAPLVHGARSARVFMQATGCGNAPLRYCRSVRTIQSPHGLLMVAV
jgi:hypothetical protein